MAAWASLSGYLYIKPGGGGLSRLKSRKKQWCVLDESRGQLLYHKCQEDARCKPPLGSLELRGAAITLDLDNHNQFVVIVDNKEVYLTAENHESMMIWLMALQSKRDQFAKLLSSSDSAATTPTTTTTTTPTAGGGRGGAGVLGAEELRERSSSDVSVCRDGSHRPLSASKSLQYSHNDTITTANNNNNTNMQPVDARSPQMRRHLLGRLGETFDAGSSSSAKKSHGDTFSSVSRQLSVSIEGTELLQRQHRPLSRLRPHTVYVSNNTDSNRGHPSPLPSVDHSSSGSTADSDDVMPEETGLRHQGEGEGQGGGGGGEGVEAAPVDPHSMGSSLSVSTDSAIDKGDNTDMGTRVQELEKELISSKCQLAKAMNRQTCFQDILKQKDEIILDLDEKLSKLGGADMAYDSKRRASQASRELQERIRILQNQNRFLNEEVRRLARLRSQELSKMKDQEGRAAALEGDIELWKLQYVSLIQSSIRFTNTDTMDDAELSLYGGDRHKNKVRSLLEEARKVNPSLPTYENLAAGEVHVDYYGFKHQFQDCGLLLHYLCMELTQHYLTQAAACHSHQLHWRQYMADNAGNLLKNKKELKGLCRGGIPDHHRRVVWRTLIHHIVSDVMTEKGPHYFRSLCSLLPDSPLAARYRKQIGLDLMRTMPSNIKFSTPGSKGIMDLQDVLLAFCVHNPNIGYCQGMNFLVAMALLFMEPQDAFWTLVAVTERYHTSSYFDQNLLGAQADQSVLRDLLGDLLPSMARHLVAIDIEITTVTLNWFLAIFFDAVPFHTLLRIWDCFLLEGPKVLFRFSLAILKMHEREIAQKTETISVMRHLKACARVTYDTDGLVHLAFKGFKPFPRRQDISSKQTVYLKALKEKYRWRELQKLAFAERENLFLSLESETGSNTETFECAVVTATGEVWVCYGSQSQCKVCVVNCSEGTMTDLAVQFSSRVMDVCTVPEAILFGTLSWTIHCYTTTDRTLAWEQQLNDAVLSLCDYQDEAASRVFAGLADGTVAVMEDVSAQTTFYDLMYVAIGQSPVTCLRLVDNHLWCACGNTVSIIHASTLDALDNFTVSSNPYDHILSLQPGLPGVWISVRGSSILELWDPASLCCKMLYDTRAGRYPCLRKDDETYFNRARITCILPLDYSVWVGTGEGNLITYDVFTHQGSKSPSDSSSFVGSYTDSLSAMMGTREEHGDHHLPSNEGYDPVREAAMRVRQLYLCQQEGGEEVVKLSSLTVSSCSTLVHNSTESVTPDPATLHHPPNTTLTFSHTLTGEGRDPGVRGFDPEGHAGREVKVSVSSGVDTLSPGLPSPGEDSDALTPVTSFCCEGGDTTGPGSHNGVTGGEGKEGGGMVTSTPNKTGRGKRPDRSDSLSGQEEGTCLTGTSEETATPENSEANRSSSEDSQQNTRTNGDSQNSGSSLRGGLPEALSQKEQGGDAVNPKSTSPKNGMHMFYIGDSQQSELKTMWTNGSVPGDTALDSSHNAGEQAAEKERKAPQHPREEPSSESNAGEKAEGQEARTSESGVEMGSTDSSVIMQLWSAITKPRKRTQDSQDSQMTSQEEEAEEAGQRGKKPSLRASMGSSLTSSLDSKHSDEVFQEVREAISTSVEDSTSASASTVMLDTCRGEREGEEQSALTSSKSMPDTSTPSPTPRSSGGDSSDGRPPQQRKRRPQSLFLSRGPRAHKPSSGCVDKQDPGTRGSKFVLGSPATPGSKSTSTSSIATHGSGWDAVDSLQPADRETQYRLDYTNLHVDTDLESVCTQASFDSRRSSSVFGDGGVEEKGEGGGQEEGDVGLGMLDCDPSSFIFPQDMYNAQDWGGSVGRAMLEGGLAQLIHTPALSSRTWSSYDEVSTPSVASCVESRTGRHHRGGPGVGGLLPRNNSDLLSATSVASTTELLYAADLTLMSKNKISDKPVKCLLLYTQESKPLLLSFSGCHTDDEAVLKWSREKDEMLWTNEPILEYNPATKTTKLPSYMAARISSSSSHNL